jgi:uncharacterized protein (TIGR03437 family)
MIRAWLPGRVFGVALFAHVLSAQSSFDMPVGLVAVDQSAIPVLYASTTGPSLFRTADNAGNWYPVFIDEAGLPQPEIGGIVFEPGNNAVIYVATELSSGGVWRSTDSGATWTPFNTGLSGDAGQVGRLWILPGSPPVLYARIGNQLYTTSSTSAAWTLQSTLPGSDGGFDLNAGQPSLMFYGEGAAISCSHDQGATWTQVATLPGVDGSIAVIYEVASDPFDPGTVYAAVRSPAFLPEGSATGGLFKSTDQGATWTNVAPGRQPNDVLIDPTGLPRVYFAEYTTNSVCASPDRGTTWQCTQVTDKAQDLLHLAVDSTHPDVLYAGTWLGIYRSTDAGGTWERITGTVWPTLAMPAQALALTAKGTGSASMPLEVRALETDRWTLVFSVTASEAWLDVNPAIGVTPAQLTVTASVDGLSPGTYNAFLTVSSTQSGNPRVQVAVVFTIEDGGSAPASAYVVETSVGSGQPGFNGDSVTAVGARLLTPQGIAMDQAGDLFIADTGNSLVRQSTPAGMVTTPAGTGGLGFAGDGGPATSATLWEPASLAVDGAGTIYIADTLNDRIRKVSPAGTITTLQSGIVRPSGLALDQSGNLYVAEAGRDRILRVDPSGVVTTVAGLADSPGFSGDGGPAVSAQIDSPSHIALDASGTLYIADTGNNRIRKVTSKGVISTLAGNDGSLSLPQGVAVDGSGDVYIADTGNHRILSVGSGGVVEMLAGTGIAGFNGDGGLASLTELNSPADVLIGPAGEIFFADTANQRIRRLTLQSAPVPQIAQGGALSAASYAAAAAPGSLIAIFGSNLATASEAAASTPLPVTLGGASVQVNGVPAPLFWASPTQVNAQVPFEVQPGQASVVVFSNGLFSAPSALTITGSAPGVFQWGASRAVVTDLSGALITTANPAPAGGIVVAYLTGQGPLDNPVPTGQAAPLTPLSRASLPVQATVGDQPATVLFLGLTPGLVGVAQANLQLPLVSTGDYLLTLTVGDAVSSPTLLSIRSQ